MIEQSVECERDPVEREETRLLYEKQSGVRGEVVGKEVLWEGIETGEYCERGAGRS